MRTKEQDEEIELPPGTLLDGRFRVISLLGEGGMGCVYLARDLEQGHDVALKLLIPRYRGRADREQRLLNEAVFARRVGDHPGMPRLYGSGRLRDLGGCPYVAWEVVQGRDLNAVLTLRYVLPPRLAAQWARQLADAVCALHRVGLVHRDVTVTNVFVERPEGDARIRLIDLSHAALVPEPGTPSRRLTREIEIPGAHRFMPPEQTLARAPHPKMDVFSFGVVLHEMLTGNNPFEHVRDREAYIDLQRAGKLHVPRIDRRVYDVPEPLVDLVEACTHNDMARRLDMIEVLRRLEDFLARASAPIRLASAEPPSAAIEPPSRLLVGVAPVAAGDGARGRGNVPYRRVLVGALVMLIVLAVVTAFVWPREPELEEDARGTAPVTTPEDEPPEERPEERPAVDAPPTLPKALQPAPAQEPTVAPEPAAPPLEPPPARARPAKTSKASKPARAPAHESEACRRTVAEAVGAEKDQAWSRLEALTRSKKCFGDRRQWTRLRAHALMETDRAAECLALADDFEDPALQKYARICGARKASR